MNKLNHIVAFEHEIFRTDLGEKRISPSQLKVLQLFYGQNGVPYYSLIHNGIKFNEYVGVIQLGKYVFEILPKADKNNDVQVWRKVLIEMLLTVKDFKIQTPTSSDLRLKTTSILDLYYKLFINELEYLIHRGLIKKYRQTNGNLSTLKGRIQFAKQITKNHIHKEKFYVEYSIYDTEHIIHSILLKALKLVNSLNTNTSLICSLNFLLLSFPNVKDINVSEITFDKLVINRKTEIYKNALQIAKLILLNFYPDVIHGRNHTLALMFDMNILWEKFVFYTLKKYNSKETIIDSQNHKNFWKSKNGNKTTIQPDIILNKGKEKCIIIDTKWKSLNGQNPSPEDLRQMYVYLKFFKAVKVALVYPGIVTQIQSGNYYHETEENLSVNECSIISILVNKNITAWQNEINELLQLWIKTKN